jgi:hypothetical protein
MMLELTSNEARLLAFEVRRRVDDLQHELVHTTRRELRAEIADERDKLQGLQRRIDELVDVDAMAG